jgi:hypothetical protein
MTLNLSLVSGSDGIKNGRQHPGPEQQEGQACFVSGRRASGSFTLKKLDGTRISKGVTFKKLRLLEPATNYLIKGCERAIPPTTKVAGLLALIYES